MANNCPSVMKTSHYSLLLKATDRRQEPQSLQEKKKRGLGGGSSSAIKKQELSTISTSTSSQFFTRATEKWSCVPSPPAACAERFVSPCPADPGNSSTGAADQTAPAQTRCTASGGQPGACPALFPHFHPCCQPAERGSSPAVSSPAPQSRPFPSRRRFPRASPA